MTESRVTSSVVARREMEEFWRVKLEEANERYQAASANYERLLRETPEALRPGKNALLGVARRARSQAQTEYVSLLKKFTDFIVHGRIPEERSAAAVRRERDSERNISHFDC